MTNWPPVSGTQPVDCGAEMLTAPQKPPHPVCRYSWRQVLVGSHASNCSCGAMLPWTWQADQPPGVAVVVVAVEIDTGTPVFPARSSVASAPHDMAGVTVPSRLAGLASVVAARATVVTPPSRSTTDGEPAKAADPSTTAARASKESGRFSPAARVFATLHIRLSTGMAYPPL